MSTVPDLSAVAETVFLSYPEDIATLNALCDQCEADRAAFGEDDERVQAGERRVNNLKGLFTRRIAWACAQQNARFGLRKKTTGAIATRPSDGLTHATDVLLWLEDDSQPGCPVVDVMSDRHSSWSVTPGDTQPRDQWVKALPEGSSVPVPLPPSIPDPVPTPTPAPTDTSGLVARILQLESRLAEVESRQAANDQATVRLVSDLEKRIYAVEQRPSSAPVPFVLPPLVAIGKIPFFGTVRLPVQKA